MIRLNANSTRNSTVRIYFFAIKEKKVYKF